MKIVVDAPKASFMNFSECAAFEARKTIFELEVTYASGG